MKRAQPDQRPERALVFLGGIFGTMISILIVLLAVLVPLGLLAWLGVKVWRRFGLSTGIGAGWTKPENTETS